jgi:hypothetical protein
LYDSNNKTFVSSPNSRATDYSAALDKLSIKFVNDLPRDAAGQAKGNGEIHVSLKRYTEMSKDDQTAANIELGAIIAHEMAHNMQSIGREPLVKVSKTSNPGQKLYSVEGPGGTEKRTASFLGGGGFTSRPTVTNVEQEPFAYYLEGKLFENEISKRNRLKSFETARNWSRVYSTDYIYPVFYWEQAIWRTTDSNKSSPPKALLSGTQF